MTFRDFFFAAALIAWAGLLGYRCIEAAPPVNIMPNYTTCQTCPCVTPDPVEVIPNSDSDRKDRRK